MMVMCSNGDGFGIIRYIHNGRLLNGSARSMQTRCPASHELASMYQFAAALKIYVVRYMLSGSLRTL